MYNIRNRISHTKVEERGGWFPFGLTFKPMTVQTLNPGQWEEDYPITTFSENKRLRPCQGRGPMLPVWILKRLVSVFINACRLLSALPSLSQFGRGRLSLVAISFYALLLLLGPCRLLEFTLAGPWDSQFFCKWTNNIPKFEGCFSTGTVSSKGFKFSMVA